MSLALLSPNVYHSFLCPSSSFTNSILHFNGGDFDPVVKVKLRVVVGLYTRKGSFRTHSPICRPFEEAIGIVQTARLPQRFCESRTL